MGKNKPPASAHYLTAHILAQEQYRLHVEMELEMLLLENRQTCCYFGFAPVPISI